MIKAKLGDGKNANISIVDECIELEVNPDSNMITGLDSDIVKVRIVPSADVDGVFIESYDKEGNFIYRSAISITELIVRTTAAKDLDLGDGL